MPSSIVLGCGRQLPARVVTGEELAGGFGLPAAEVDARCGILRRHYADSGVGPSELAYEASLQALAAAGRTAEDVDLIVFATMTPDLAFPGSGCLLQDRLGCRTVGAFDVRAQCAGFLYALAVGDRFVRTGAMRHVLVLGGEVHSAALDFSPAGARVTPYFGDGAGAVLLGAGAQPGVLATVLHGDPRELERFWCEFPASRNFPVRMDIEHFRAGRHFYQLDAERVHPQAEQALTQVVGEALDRAGVAEDRVALFLLHYFDPRVARRVADALGIAAERVVATAEAAGHIAAAGIPIALAEAVTAGRVGQGDLVCCAAFGAGMSWAGAVLRL